MIKVIKKGYFAVNVETFYFIAKKWTFECEGSSYTPREMITAILE